MKFLRNNFAYLLLGVIAVILILVTLSLQVAIFSTQTTADAQSDRTLFFTLRQRLAELIQPANDTPVTSTTATVGQPASTTAVVLPTNTPNIIVVQPSPPPPTPVTVAQLPPPTTDPATATLLPGAYNVSAVATRLAAPTVTSSAAVALLPSPTPLSTATTLPPATNTPDVAADFRIGYVESNATCTAVTELMTLVLEGKFGLQIATIPFPDAASLFAKLAEKSAAERVDLSFCYVDPDDRTYLQKYFGFIIFIGSGYRQLNNQKFIVMSNAGVKSPIERGNPCLYRFLTNLNLNDVNLDAGDMNGWYQDHAEQVANWTRCES